MRRKCKTKSNGSCVNEHTRRIYIYILVWGVPGRNIFADWSPWAAYRTVVGSILLLPYSLAQLFIPECTSFSCRGDRSCGRTLRHLFSPDLAPHLGLVVMLHLVRYTLAGPVIEPRCTTAELQQEVTVYYPPYHALYLSS